MEYEVLINVGIALTLLILGYVFGKIAESRHYKSIAKREAELLHLPTTNTKRPLGTVSSNCETRLCSGSVVISVDYFKRMVAGLRNIFGGKV